MDRRTFLQRLGLGAGMFALPSLLSACSDTTKTVLSTHHSVHHAKKPVSIHDGLPVADWLVAENRRPGTSDWAISSRSQRKAKPIEGFVDQVSVVRGDELTLFVNTPAASWRAEVFRMGFYGGSGARLVESTHDFLGRTQPKAVFAPGINMVSCPWSASHRFVVGSDWLPGNYLIRLRASSGSQHYVPVTVRDDTSHAAIAVQNSVTTWQAYNHWGGYSLYGGIPLPGQDDYSSRSRIVSFDRPYANPDKYGSGDWLGNEFPFIYLVERYGLDVTYLTNVDVDTNPARLSNHRVLVSLGHDEYWSWAMRYGVQDATLKGLNVAFMGANSCYRQIRYAASALGERRQVICYKDYTEDPIHTTKPWLATGVSWATTPHQRPESYLVGAMYQGYGASGDMVIYDPSSFLFAGMDIAKSEKIKNVIGSEYDAYEPSICPSNVQILAHSPTKGVNGHSDMTYYTTPTGGGIFDSGTADFVTSLWDGSGTLDGKLSFGIAPAETALSAMMLNLLRVFASGPAGLSHPSLPNWQAIYSKKAPVVLGRDVS